MEKSPLDSHDLEKGLLERHSTLSAPIINLRGDGTLKLLSYKYFFNAKII
jgi:hypothetical protein